MSRRSISCLFIFCLIFVTACAGRGEQATPYLPPTGIPRTTPLVLPTREQPASEAGEASSPTGTPEPIPTPACTADLTFLDDLTIPDGSTVAPGEALDKRWEVENSGTCNWDASYSLRLVAGQDLGAAEEQALFPARSGAQATIRIAFTAPDEPGDFRSAWQAFDPQGEPFGDPFYIEINVAEDLP